jgi:hypothetical protein
MSTHQAAFKALEARFTADNGADGFNNAASQNHLFGGFVRRGNPQRTFQTPWIEVEIAGEREQDSMGGRRSDLVIRFHVFTKRDRVFSTDAGNQDDIVAHLAFLMHGATMAADATLDWYFNKMYRTSGVQAPDDGNYAHFVETYLLRLSVYTGV